MPPSTSSDLAPFRRLAFLTLGLSAAIVIAMAIFRIGILMPWVSVGSAWLMLCAALLGPLPLLKRFAPPSWSEDLSVGPSVIGALFLVWLFGFLGIAGWVLIAAMAVLGLASALRAELPKLRASRLVAGILLILILAVPLIGTLDGSRYANFIADRLMLFGRADGDTMFHAALINALRVYRMPATGIDGIVLAHYHVGAHWLAAQIPGEAVVSLIALRCVLLTPLAFFAIAAGGILWSRRRGTAVDRPMLAMLLALVLTLGIGACRIGAAGFNSESATLAAALGMLAFPSLLIAAGENRLTPLAWIGALALVFLLAAAKISFGFVWGGVVGWWALRKLGLRQPAFWAIVLADAVVFGAAFYLFNPGGSSGALWFGTPYYLDLIRSGTWFAPLLLNLVGFAVMAIMAAVWRRPSGRDGITARHARDVVEILAVIFVLANLPGALTEIPGGDIFYFIVVFGWLALPLMTGELLRQAEIRGHTLPARTVAGVLLVACIVGLVLIGERQWRIIVNTEALIRTGDTQYYVGKSQRGYRVAANKAMKELGLAGIFTAPPAVPPASPILEALMYELAVDDPRTTAIYVPPTTTNYWALTDDCDGKSLLAMAAAGVPILNGYYPDQTACAQEFALLGYAGLPADLGKPLDDAAICMRAQAIHVTTVLVIEDAVAAKTRTLACPAR